MKEVCDVEVDLRWPGSDLTGIDEVLDLVSHLTGIDDELIFDGEADRRERARTEGDSYEPTEENRLYLGRGDSLLCLPSSCRRVSFCLASRRRSCSCCLCSLWKRVEGPGMRNAEPVDLECKDDAHDEGEGDD